MAIQTLAMLRTEVKFRFIEYLKNPKHLTMNRN